MSITYWVLSIIVLLLFATHFGRTSHLFFSAAQSFHGSSAVRRSEKGKKSVISFVMVHAGIYTTPILADSIEIREVLLYFPLVCSAEKSEYYTGPNISFQADLVCWHKQIIRIDDCCWKLCEFQIPMSKFKANF